MRAPDQPRVARSGSAPAIAAAPATLTKSTFPVEEPRIPR